MDAWWLSRWWQGHGSGYNGRNARRSKDKVDQTPKAKSTKKKKKMWRRKMEEQNDINLSIWFSVSDPQISNRGHRVLDTISTVSGREAWMHTGKSLTSFHHSTHTHITKHTHKAFSHNSYPSRQSVQAPTQLQRADRNGHGTDIIVLNIDVNKKWACPFISQDWNPDTQKIHPTFNWKVREREWKKLNFLKSVMLFLRRTVTVVLDDLFVSKLLLHNIDSLDPTPHPTH